MNKFNTLSFSNINLAWIDLEMTGLDIDNDYIIEIAAVVTDSMLNTIVHGPTLAIYQNNIILNNMNTWNKNIHISSGLIDRVRKSNITEHDAMKQVILFFSKYIPIGTSPMCGNSIHQDRKFIYKWMPDLNNFFHYRHIDVSSIKELYHRWNPNVYKNFHKKSNHTALGDIIESIKELNFYKKNFFKI